MSALYVCLICDTRSVHAIHAPQVHPINQFWEDCMRAVDRPSAVKMTALLDPAFPLGIDPASKGVSSAKDGLFAHYKQVRSACPGSACTPDI